MVTDKIIQWLMANKFPEYTVHADPNLAFLSHPNYFNSVGGAWRLAEHIAERAECQAIVRLVRASLLVLGATGTFKIAIVFTDEKGKAIEDDLEQGGTGLEFVTCKFNGKTVEPRLLDADPGPVGSVFEVAPGFPAINYYEACLKFSDVEPPVYYTGGAANPPLHNIDEVIRVFTVLVWLSDASPAPNGNARKRVEKIVARYRP
jgi:hypothetical protein